MMQLLLIGLSAGLASALLFASVASGSLLSIPLFYLAPLPILIAAMGWSHVAGLIAAVAAASGLAIALGTFFFIGFLVGVGLPAWWLSYLALLARPGAAATNGSHAAAELEWYPVGRIVIWAAVLSAAVISLGLFAIGTNEDGLRAALASTFERMQARAPGSSTSKETDPNRYIDLFVALLPPAAAILATLINVFSLWLAARIVRVSGRLRRPWPDLTAMSFPHGSLMLLAAALALSFLPDLPGILGTVLSASMLMAFALLGLAVLHVVTRHMNGRGFILGGMYGAIAVLGWPVLAAALLGIADAAFDLRARAGRPPSIPKT